MAQRVIMNLLPFDEALARIGSMAVASLGTENVALADALGRVLAAPVTSPADIPRFDNSAVDGFALGAGVEGPFRIVGESSAGLPFAGVLKPGEATRIATGAVLPEGAAAVAMQENCTVSGDRVIPCPVPPPGTNCRRAGQDVAVGVTVLYVARFLAAPELSMLAALGLGEVSVRKRLRVAIASTGNELIETGAVTDGQTFDSNRPLLKALLQAWPVEIVDLGIVPDAENLTRRVLLQAAADCDLILTTGGVSVGARDYVRETVEREGRVIFWRLAVKPGKPLLLGTLGATPLLGLPGNPVSAFVMFNLVARPLMCRLLGMPAAEPLRIPVRLGFAYRKSAILREFIRVSVAREGEALAATPFRSQLSNLISSLLESDGLLDLPVGRDAFEPGEIFDFIPWRGF